ncbi:MAG: DoxX family membrane protein [Gemmatimonadota bacterium]|nr:DoxX family membrane protein [Gemmatimonadota bacterium]
MKAWSLLLTRVTVGWLLVLWGIDKLVNVEHSVAVAETFYFGVGTQVVLLNALGVLEIALGVLVVVGALRRVAYPVMVAVLGVTAIGVWRSILDPWGWVLEGTQVLFYPSSIIFAAALVLWAFVDEDVMCVDAKRS